MTQVSLQVHCVLKMCFGKHVKQNDCVNNKISHSFLFPDSIVSFHTPGDPEMMVGDFLGDYTNELDDGDHIKQWRCLGCKNYSYKTAQGQEVCKIRGFTLNYRNSLVLNFEKLDHMVKNWNETVETVNPSKICRDKKTNTLYNRREVKVYRAVYTKRQINSEMDTFPYGF